MRLVKTALAAVLLCLLFQSVCGAAGMDNFKKKNPWSTGKFVDVAKTDWFADSVRAAYEYGLMNGKSEWGFDPDGTLTVSEVLTITARMHSIYRNGAAVFPSSDPWYSAYVDYLNRQGITSYHAGWIPPDYGETDNGDEEWFYGQAATRALFAELISSALSGNALSPINTVEDHSIPDVFDHMPEKDAIYRLYRAGIMTGSDEKGRFHPDDSIKRSEVAAVLSRIVEADSRRTITLRAPRTAEGWDELEEVLKKKGFTSEINELIRSVYRSLIEHYDGAYAVQKVSLRDYLTQFREALENRINEAILHDPDSEKAAELELNHGTPAVYNTVSMNLNLIPDGDEAQMTTVMTHELRHAMDRGFESILSASHSSAVDVLIEGSAARGEDFAMAVPERDVSFQFGTNYNGAYRSIYSSSETPGRSYQRNETMYDHFEFLLGMDRMERVKVRKGDFLLNLRRELIAQYGTTVGENVLMSYILLTKAFDAYGMNYRAHEDTQIDTLKNDVAFWNNLRCEHFLGNSHAIIDMRLRDYREKLERNQGYLEIIPGMTGLTDEEKAAFLEQAQNNVDSFLKFTRLTENLKVHTQDELNEFAQFCVRLELMEMEALADKRDGKVTAADWALDFENACNEALKIRIRNAKTAEEREDLKTLLILWKEQVMLNVVDNWYENGPNRSAEQFERDVAGLIEMKN